MSTPTAKWDEEYVLALPLEDSGLERKGTRALDLKLAGVKEDRVLEELAVQLSAFANTGGGRIIYGLSNSGQVDAGGVSRCVKGRSTTKEWLEDVVAHLTDPRIIGLDVYEIAAEGPGSAIDQGKALYVIDVPNSDRAPHQSKRDYRYYIRAGSKCLPAIHSIIEDIRNRARHPEVHVEFEILAVHNVMGGVGLEMRATASNQGRIKAQNTCLYVEMSPPTAGVQIGSRDDTLHVVEQRQGKDHRSAFFELRHPLYPQMETSFRFRATFLARAVTLCPITGRVTWAMPNSAADAADECLSWMLFADSAPPRRGKSDFRSLGIYNITPVAGPFTN